jgi:molybdopterin/thiamine biosynthesis adenylyltransferase
MGVRLLRLVDRDRVEEKNLATQDFHPTDVGRFKAEALADRLQSQFPNLKVEARCADLEDIPLGDFAVDVVLGALDSRRARQSLITETAWPLRVPVVDGGVGEGLVGRVQVFVPRADTACLECTWGDADYRQLVAEYPCLPVAGAGAPPTVSPAFAGTVVAGLMTAECVRLLAGPAPSESREMSFDLYHQRFLVSRLRRSPRCRFDHQCVREVFALAKGFGSATLGDVVQAIGSRFGSTRAHVECRRRLLAQDSFNSGRFVALDRLRDRAGESLAALGFVPQDRLRVRTAERSAFVLFHPGREGA